MFRFRQREQRGIELYEGRVDRCVVFMALIAVRRPLDLLRGLRFAECEEAPSPFQTGIFYVHFEAHDVGRLRVASFVDGDRPLRAATLEYEHSFFWPGSGLLKSMVCGGVDEHILKHRVSGNGSAGVVAHVDTGGKEDPFAVVFRPLQFTVCRVSGAIRGSGARLLELELLSPGLSVL